jgi:hypothetical protein
MFDAECEVRPILNFGGFESSNSQIAKYSNSQKEL